MKENKGKRFRLPSNRFLAALVVVALTIAALGVTMTLLGCNEDSTDIFCNGCAQQIPEPTAHQASCGISGHYSCDGNEHSKELCAPDSEDAGHTHTFGDATCIAPAACTVEGCTETSGEVNANNHTGGTEVKDTKAATCAAEGYSGDTYCKSCNTVIQKGSATAKSTTHRGGTEVKGKKDATCGAEGYTGDTCCKSCNTVIQKGSAIAKSATHSGGTEVKGKKDATCCEEGFSGDTHCTGCGAKLSSGSTVAATGNHPAAGCNKSGHHAHDQGNHGGAACLILGHYACDGNDHLDWMCMSSEDLNNTVRVEITIANPGSTWSYTIGGHTVSSENIDNYDYQTALGGYSIEVYMTTLQGYTFTIDTTNDKKVYIADYSENAGYNDMIVNGEDPVTITVSKEMLKADTYEDHTDYTLFITIKDPA